MLRTTAASNACIWPGRNLWLMARSASRFSASLSTIVAVPYAIAELNSNVKLPSLGPTVGVHLVTADSATIGFAAMLIAHTTFCLPYVILSVLPRVEDLGASLTEAAMDLGCTPVQSFFKVELPNIMPGVISGFIMAFTLSLDDFVISYFVGSSEFQTLPLLIYSMTKKKVTPDMYALSTLIIITIFVLLLVSNLRSGKARKKEANSKK